MTTPVSTTNLITDPYTGRASGVYASSIGATGLLGGSRFAPGFGGLYGSTYMGAPVTTSLAPTVGTGVDTVLHHGANLQVSHQAEHINNLNATIAN